MSWRSSPAKALPGSLLRNTRRAGFAGDAVRACSWRPEDGGHVSIMAGTLDNSDGLEAVEHIYVGAKGEYYELTDDLPKSQGRT